ncbi:MAG: chromate transporter [Oscillospiraceae bacterium]|nr:chromate transporter [Oscillospiraceae bacterium]
MTELLRLLWTFLKLGAFTVGGGYAIIPLIHQEMTAAGYMTQTEALNMVAISQMTPGPLAINAATFAGMRTAGVAGALTATVGVVLPSFVLATLAGKYFFRFQESTLIRSMLSGMRPVVLALIAAAALELSRETFFWERAVPLWERVDLPALAVAAVCAVAALTVRKLPPALLIAAAGVFGALFLR